jgi:NarL family two-component system response regulator LiaR
MEVLLIDDHPLTNNGLASCLEETGRFFVSGQANTLSEAKRFIEEAKNLPSLIMLDILLGEENGLDFLPFLKSFCRGRRVPMPPVLVCSVLEDPFRIQSALKLGASGYIPKTETKAVLLKAIDTVLQGEVYISNEHAVKLSKSLGTYEQFTKRELEVLNLIKQNKSNQEIAKALYINIRTVENHISNIYFKTGCCNRLELKKL